MSEKRDLADVGAAAPASTTPLVERPAPNAKQEASRGVRDALVWEAVTCGQPGRPWQWRAWLDGVCVGVVTRRQKRKRKGAPVEYEYLPAAMEKTLPPCRGQNGPPQDRDKPPSMGALNAVSYTVVEIVRSGSAVVANAEMLQDLGEGPEADAAREACAALRRAHEARYEVDEGDLPSVHAANQQVQKAADACDPAFVAAAQAAKTPEERAAEARKVIEGAAATITAFNAAHAAAGRRG